MADRRMVGHAVRRRMGEPSSHLAMALENDASVGASQALPFHEIHEMAHIGTESSAAGHNPGHCGLLTGDGVPVCHHCGSNPVPPVEPYLTHAVGEPLCRNCFNEMRKSVDYNGD